MARFFIDRPVFAWVISIIIMGIGILSILTLPVAQYPQIAPPSVTIRATYPGASAETISNTVTQVIEQQMTGLDGLRYISSGSTSAGSSSTTRRSVSMRSRGAMSVCRAAMKSARSAVSRRPRTARWITAMPDWLS